MHKKRHIEFDLLLYRVASVWNIVASCKILFLILYYVMSFLIQVLHRFSYAIPGTLIIVGNRPV